MAVSLRRYSVFDSDRHGSYHLAFACHGYEQRSVHAPQQFASIAERKIAIGFDSRKVLSFDDNGDRLSGHGFELVEMSDWEVRDFAANAIKEVERDMPEGEIPRVALDCSSFSRLRLAAVLSALSEAADRLDLDVYYSPARFSEADPVELEVLRVAEPISFEFSGWNADQERPVAVVIGVGYEDGRATGIAEFLDAPNIHIFNPTGVDVAYDQAVEHANADFFESFPVHTYDVRKPGELFSRLESLSYGLRRSNRLSVVPLGPKIFAATAMLVSFNSGHQDAVWRFSSDMGDAPIQKLSDGSVCVLPVRMATAQNGKAET